MESSFAIEVHNLTKDFGGLRAVDGVSLQVPHGQRRALIGPNGAGKTTLFNCITGSLPPTAGQILLFGKDVTRLPENERTQMGMGRTYQITNVFSNLTVLENALLAVQGTSKNKWILHRSLRSFPEDLARAKEELQRFGLKKRAADLVSQLSYGERKQLEFALAMSTRPRVLFLDEPCSGLSLSERQRISQIIAGMPREITIVLIEHDMDICLNLVDQVVVLSNGRIILEGTPDEVRASAECREIYLGKSC